MKTKSVKPPSPRTTAAFLFQCYHDGLYLQEEVRKAANIMRCAAEFDRLMEAYKRILKS
jgi:hypothetical protein